MKNKKIALRALLFGGLLSFCAMNVCAQDTSLMGKHSYPIPLSSKPVRNIPDTARLKPNVDTTHVMPPNNSKSVPPFQQKTPQQTPPLTPPPNRRR